MLDLLVLSLLAPSGTMNSPQELSDYVHARDASFKWERAKSLGREAVFMTAQTWHGVAWKHHVMFVEPQHNDHKDTAILVVTGAEPMEKDLAWAKRLADGAHMSVATLFEIPNQPLWEKREDDLIAYTFEQYLDSGDASWPLLFPMAKSAVRAMDAIQGARKQVKHFVVTGMSKRGWTTWLVGALGDKRVAGIAPMVFDNLNMLEQMHHQLDVWGHYSPMIDSYTSQDIQTKVSEGHGPALARMVDPLSYRNKLAVPTLIVTGSNDPYWAPDAMTLYFNQLKQPHWAVMVPNSGHGLEDEAFWLPTLAAFSRSCAGEFAFPSVAIETRRVTNGGPGIEILARCGAPVERYGLWRAFAKDNQFAEARWTSSTSGPELSGVSPNEVQASAFPQRSRDGAAFLELDFEVKGLEFKLTSPTYLLPKL